MTIAEFKATSVDDGLSFSAGVAVTVVTKNPSGWWYVELGDQEGWVPSSYLEKAGEGGTNVSAPPPVPPNVPVKKRNFTQSGKKASLRRSTSDETLHSKAASLSPVKHGSFLPVKPNSASSSPSPPKPTKSSSPSSRPTKPSSASKQISVSTGKLPHKDTSWAERSLPAKLPVKKTPVSRSSSSDNHLKKSSPQAVPRAQHALNPAKPQIRLPSTGSREKPGPQSTKGQENSTPGVMRVADLAKLLQKQSTLTSPTETKTLAPRSGPKTPSPSAQRRAETAKRPEKPKPYSPAASAKRDSPAASAKRAPPKRPEPPKATANSTGKKPAPARPSNSPALKKKASFYTVACDYEGGTNGCLPLREGQLVEVLDKGSDGWWYIKSGAKEGWAPGTFLETNKPARPPNPQLKQPKMESSRSPPSPRPVPKPRARKPSSSNSYIAAVSYTVPPYEDSGIDLVAGRTYEVQEKAEGWWYVTDGHREGWAPASYFDPA